MELTKIKCPSCGENTPVAESGEGFCLYCGAKLHAERSANPLAIEEVRRLYTEYIEWVVKFFESSTPISRAIASFFAGNNDFKRHENHARFIEDVRAAAQDIEKLYADSALSRDDIVALLRFVLFENNDVTGLRLIKQV